MHILGEVKGEEEPEGEALGEESTGNKYNLYFTQGQFSKQFSLLPYTSACFYCSTTSLLDESEEEGAVQLLTKEEEEKEVMKSWVEAGGFPT